MEKSCRNYTPKASPRTLHYFDKKPKVAIAYKKLRCFEKGLSKNLYQEKLNLFFLSNPISFSKQDYEK